MAVVFFLLLLAITWSLGALRLWPRGYVFWAGAAERRRQARVRRAR